MGDTELHALDSIDLEVYQGEYVAIMGPSGCGKSTLLNVLGCLDRPSRGAYLLGGTDVSTLSDDDLSEIRGARLGFIFQSYNLIQQLTLENIEVPLYYQGQVPESSRQAKLLRTVAGRASPYAWVVGGNSSRRVSPGFVNNPLLLRRMNLPATWIPLAGKYWF